KTGSGNLPQLPHRLRDADPRRLSRVVLGVSSAMLARRSPWSTLLVALAGCGGSPAPGPGDASVLDGAQAARDSAAVDGEEPPTPDLAAPDLEAPDLAPALDLFGTADLVPPPDLMPPPDLATPIRRPFDVTGVIGTGQSLSVGAVGTP